MRDYKRLTERSGEAFALKSKYASDNIAIWHAIKRLAELEDKIENGTLIELPCKVDDTVYWITSSHEIVKAVVNAIRIVEKRVIYYVEEDGVGEYTIIDTNFYLTKPEAEAKLKELKGE